MFEEEEEEAISYPNKELVLQWVQYSKKLYGKSLDNQQEAVFFFNQFVHHQDSFLIGLEILKHFKTDLHSIFLALCVFNSILSESWASWDQKYKEELKQILFQILNSDTLDLISKKASEIIAKIAIIEFPEIWDDFLLSTLTSGNSYILICYLEHIEDINEVPYSRRQFIHNLFLEHFDLIRNAIFASPIISPTSLSLFSMMAKWTPLERIATEQTIELLTTTLLQNQLTRHNSIECLDTIFVQRRLDARKILPPLHFRLFTNLYAGASEVVEIAALLANILASHLEFFRQHSSNKQTFERKKVLPQIQFPDEFEEEEEESQANLQGPITEIVEIEVHKYFIYDNFKECFLLLANPAWCLSKPSDLENEENEMNDDQLLIKNEEEDKNEEDSYPREPQLYWSTWRQFFEFATSLKCNIEENPILREIPTIFRYMISYITTACSFNSIVNGDTRNCFNIIFKHRPDLIEEVLTSQADINIPKLYLACCVIDEINQEAANEYVDRFLVPTTDPFILSHLIRCISFLLRFFPEKIEILDFFCQSISFLGDFSTIDSNLRIAMISALRYLATYTPGVFYYNDYQILHLVISILDSLPPGQVYDLPIIQSLFNTAAVAILPMIDIDGSYQAIAHVTKNMIEFLAATFKDILEAPDDLFKQFYSCVTILKNFSRRCFRLFNVHGEFLIDMCIEIIQSKDVEKRNLDLIELSFELAESLICNYNDLPDELDKRIHRIIEPALNGTSSQNGFMLQFLTHLATSLSLSRCYYLDLNKAFLPALMENIQPDSQYVLDYLLKTKYWSLEPEFELPLQFMSKIINNFPFVCAKPGLLIIKEFCSNYQSSQVMSTLAKQGQAIFTFLTEILMNSTYKNYFYYSIYAYMAFFEACFRIDFNESEILKSFFEILMDLFSKPNVAGFLFDEEQIPNEGEEIKPKEVLFQEQKEHFFVSFLEHCRNNFKNFEAMKMGLSNLYIAANYCFTATSYSFILPQKETEKPIIDHIELLLEKDQDEIIDDLLNDFETNAFIEGLDDESIEHRILKELKEFQI